MSTRGFSRRDLLHLGGKLVMTVGAAKIVVALPGCGGDDAPAIDGPPVDAPGGPDAYDYYSYTSLDDCHAVGTYQYDTSYPGPPAYTYHYYWTGVYGCPGYIYPPVVGLYCYTDYLDFVPGYSHFCFSGYYYNVTMP